MDSSFNRRDALKGMLSAGAMALVQPASALPHASPSQKSLSQESPISVGASPVELALTAISPLTVRITVQAIEAGSVAPLPVDGALVKEQWGRPSARLRTLTGSRTVKCGEIGRAHV